MIQSMTLLEAPTALDGSAHGRFIMPSGFPYMNFGSGLKPAVLPTGVTDADWNWFVTNGPRLPLKIKAIRMLANGGAPSVTQDAILLVLLDQNRKYLPDGGGVYPVTTQPTAQYQLMPLGSVEYRYGVPRETYREFSGDILFTADDCFIVDLGGTGGGSVQLAWTLFYET